MDMDPVIVPRREYLVLVRLNISDPIMEPVHFVLEFDFEPSDNIEYWINAHTCPMNLTRFAVAWGTNPDPHGLLQYVAHVPRPEGWNDDTDVQMEDAWENWCAIFPQLKGIAA